MKTIYHRGHRGTQGPRVRGYDFESSSELQVVHSCMMRKRFVTAILDEVLLINRIAEQIRHNIA